MPRLLCDQALLDGATAALPLAWLDGFALLPFAARDLAGAPDLTHADALLLRTVTPLPGALLARMPRLAAVATLSSGTDHVDTAALAARGIALNTGHGGNARAVADWVEWALAGMLSTGTWRNGCTFLPVLSGRRVLVVGVGAVGTLVAARLGACGAEVWLCDPPRAAREPGFASMDLDAALAAGPDVVTLHVPKVSAGPHATTNLLHAERLHRLRGAVLLNAARGGVLDEAAAVAARAAGHLAGLALDTFVGEPRPRSAVVAAADRVTPHIGGHSIEGKLRVSLRAIAGLRAQFGLPPHLDLAAAVARVVAELDAGTPPTGLLTPHASLDAADAGLRACVAADQPFDALRHSHRRLELPAW